MPQIISDLFSTAESAWNTYFNSEANETEKSLATEAAQPEALAKETKAELQEKPPVQEAENKATSNEIPSPVADEVQANAPVEENFTLEAQEAEAAQGVTPIAQQGLSPQELEYVLVEMAKAAADKLQRIPSRFDLTLKEKVQIYFAVYSLVLEKLRKSDHPNIANIERFLLPSIQALEEVVAKINSGQYS